MSRSRFLSDSGLTSVRTRLPKVGNGNVEAGPNLTCGTASDDADAAAAAPLLEEPVVDGSVAAVVGDGVTAELAEVAAAPPVMNAAFNCLQ